jgi:hypothetical protein
MPPKRKLIVARSADSHAAKGAPDVALTSKRQRAEALFDDDDAGE